MAGDVDAVVGIDVGTTSVKFVAVAESGEVLGSAESDPIAMSSPAPGAAVQRPDDIWAAMAGACRAGMASLPASVHVRAAALATQSGSVVPVTDDGEHEAITWMDTRSQALVRSWDASTVRTVRSTSGWQPAPGLGLATIAWYRSETERAVDVRRWAGVDDCMVHRLTGSWVTNPSNAAGMQLMDVRLGRWSSDLCAMVGVGPEQLADVRPSGAVLGSIGPAAAAATGLPESASLVVGGHDQACAALGLGVAEPGDAFLATGTAWVLTIITGSPDGDAVPNAFNVGPHVVAERWSTSKLLGGFGAELAPALDGGRPPDRQIDDCAFAVRRAVEAASVGGLDDLTVVGGGTRSGELLQRIADAIATPLTVRPGSSWPAIGAAVLAARARGWSIAPGADLPAEVVAPDPDGVTALDRRFGEYVRRIDGDRR